MKYFDCKKLTKTCLEPAGYALLLLLFLLNSCTEKEEITIEPTTIEPTLEVSSGDLVFGSGASSKDLSLESNILSDLTVTVPESEPWCKASISDNILTVKVDDNRLPESRTTTLTVRAKTKSQDILVAQQAYGFKKDKPVKVKMVTASSYTEGHEPEKMLDEKTTTHFNSKSGAIKTWPFYLDLYFEGVDKIDYLVHTPRQDTGNKWGAIGKFELWVATELHPTLTKLSDEDFKQVLSAPSKIQFKEGLEKPVHIQFRIRSAYENRVSCALMQFFKRETTEPFDYLRLFTDPSCSELKPGLTVNELNQIPDLFYRELALGILNGTYDKEFRIQNYRPYQHPNLMAAKNKTRQYSLKDNATGIYVDKPGENLIVFAGNLKGQNVTLNIRDYKTNAEENYSLSEGLNLFTPTIPGLIYVYNHTQENIPLFLTSAVDKAAAAQKTVRINIVTGGINGYFDISKHKAGDWTRILDNYAKHTEIDVLGKHTHVVWKTADYRDNKTDIVLMTNHIDDISNQQKEFMGLYYYNRAFRNRVFLHIDYSAPTAYATAYRTAYNPDYAGVFCTESGFRKRMWVLGHEMGHVNQTRPEMRWAGAIEVTNNLFTMYNQQRVLGEANRLTPGANNKKDNYNVAFDLIIKGKRPWVMPGEYVGKTLTKLAPIWQLKLYFSDILKQEHFFHDFFEHYRTTPSLSPNLGDAFHGLLQLDFVRQVCNTGKINLLEFFEEWGFLRPVNAVINDYGNKTLIVTQQQIDALKEEIRKKNYPKPAIKVQALTDKNYRQYIR